MPSARGLEMKSRMMPSMAFEGGSRFQIRAQLLVHGLADAFDVGDTQPVLSVSHWQNASADVRGRMHR